MEELYTFGEALELLKEGNKAARIGWNGKGMWLALVKPEDMCNYSLTPIFHSRHHAYEYNMAPWIGIKAADGQVVPWTPSQIDLLAEDWVIVL